MRYWQAYKLVLKTNLKVTGVVVLIVAALAASQQLRKNR